MGSRVENDIGEVDLRWNLHSRHDSGGRYEAKTAKQVPDPRV